MTDVKMKKDKVSFWKERNMLKLVRDHPLGVVLVLILSILFWFVLVGPLLDEAEAKTESRGAEVTQVQLASAVTNAPDTDPGVSPPRGCEFGCNSTTAAKKFRKGKIHASNGVTAKRLFEKPAKAKRLIVKKFKRMLHNRYAAARSNGVATTAAGMCTSDSYACAKSWYSAAFNARCQGTGDTYAGGRGKCSEYPALKYTMRSFWENLRVFNCAGTAAVSFYPGTAGFVRFFTISGGIEECWAAVD